ncbi:MAG: ABC transporter permease [Spirochaetes bacterium DG_61]|nr:MAG: ABC transporter permease [Spirochaetes bacterium DG_61]
MKKGDQIISYAMILPAFLLVFVLLIVPMFQNIYYSFFEWDGLKAPVFIGLRNYVSTISDNNFIVSLRNTLIWVGFTLVFPVMGGLLIAIFINGIVLENFFKSIFFIPITISFVATGIIWNYMFSREMGVINNFLPLIGIHKKVSWLTEVPLNTFALLIGWTWQQLGINMVLFLMGLVTIPKDQTEAAMIDGANKWQLFIHVTFPMLRPITTIVITMAMVNSFKAFDIIYVMTRGGPARTSETLAVTMFRETFTLFRMGYGAAISVILSVIVITVSSVYIKRMTRKDLLYY